MSFPRASLGLALLGLLSLAGWGCSKGPSKDDDAKTGGEVKKSEDSDGPRDGRTGRVVGKVLRKMQADEQAEARGVAAGNESPQEFGRTPESLEGTAKVLGQDAVPAVESGDTGL